MHPARAQARRPTQRSCISRYLVFGCRVPRALLSPHHTHVLVCNAPRACIQRAFTEGRISLHSCADNAGITCWSSMLHPRARQSSCHSLTLIFLNCPWTEYFHAFLTLAFFLQNGRSFALYLFAVAAASSAEAAQFLCKSLL
jgi:hypothetical protein